MAARTPGPERLAAPPGDDPGADPPEARYTVLGELARGGLGRVFTATDDALGRQVAIKQPIGDSVEALVRFEREAKLTARLQHAGVVPVYDLGRFPDGEPFFVMKMMEGRSLAELIRQASSPAERLRLLPRVLAVADTMAYAHSRGVIHRDLKPANVISSDYGETVVIDWGLARICPDASDDIIADDLPVAPEPPDLAGSSDPVSAASPAPGLTGAGRVLGTPQFMPPEQAAGAVVDARADVYALGAILYNVLTGEEPYPGESKSQVLDRVRSRPPVPVAVRAPGLPDDLAAIVDVAMSRDPQRRYANAGELAQDLRRFLDGQLVRAHRYSPSDLLRRWVRRHRAAVTVAAVLLAALAAAGVVGVRRIVAERNAALAARQAALARENVLTLFQAQRSLPLEPTAALAWLKRYRPTPDQAWMARALAEEAVAQGAARHVFRFPAPARTMAVSGVHPYMAVGTGDGPVVIYDLRSGWRAQLGERGPGVTALAFSPQGSERAQGAVGPALLAALDASGRLRLWISEEPAPAGAKGAGRWRLLRERSLASSAVGSLTFSTDGRWLALVMADKAVAVLGGADLAEGSRFELPERISTLAYCPARSGAGSGPLVVSDMAGHVVLAEPSGASPRPLPGIHADVRMVCLPGGDGFVTGGIDGDVRQWDLERGLVRTLHRHQDWISALTVTPDGKIVASGSGDDTIVLHRLAAAGNAAAWPSDRLVLAGHEDTVRGLSFSPDGSRLGSVGFDSSLRLWDVASGQVLRTTGAQRARSTRLWLASDGRHLVSGGPEQALVWPLSGPSSRLLRGHTDLLVSAEWSASGRQLVTGSRDRTVRLWDVTTGKSRLLGPALHDSWPMAVRFVGERQDRVFVGTRLGGAVLVDIASGSARALPVEQVDPVGTMGPFIMLSPDRRFMAYASRGRVLVQPVEPGTRSGPSRLPLDTALPAVTDLVWSRDGRRLGVSTRDGVVGIWSTETGRAEKVHRLGTTANELAFTPDERWAAVLTGQNRLWLWHLGTHEIREVPSERVPGTQLVASRDSRSFLHKGTDMTIRLLDIASRELRVLRAHRSRLVDVVRAPGSALLSSSDESGLVRLWNLETGQTAVLLGHGGAVDGMEYSPDGRWLATIGADAGIRIWDMSTVPLAHVPTGDPAWLEAHTSAVVDSDNELVTP